MTRHDFKLILQIICSATGVRANVKAVLVEKFAAELALEYPKFDQGKFHAAGQAMLASAKAMEEL